MSEGKKALNHIFEEEEEVSKAFEMNNFYTNQRLNIAELKSRLERFKSKNRQSLPLKDRATPIKEDRNEDSGNKIKPLKHFETPPATKASIKGIKYRSIGHKEEASITQEEFPTINEAVLNNDSFIKARQEEVRKNNYRILREVRKGRYEGKTNTSHGPRHLSTLEHKTLNPVSQAKHLLKY